MTNPRVRALLEGLYDALAAGDRPGIESVLTEDFVGQLTPGLPFGIGGEHKGAEAMIREGWFAIGKHWRVRAFPESFQCLEDGRLQVQGTYRGQGRVSGIPFDAWFIHQWDVRDDRIAGLTQLTDSAAFVAALGDEQPLSAIEMSYDDGVATVCIARPESRNAIDQTVADELLVAALRVSRLPGLRAVLLCGKGADLTVGGDIAYFTERAGDDLGALLRRMTTPFHLAFEVFAALDAPIVTAAQGAVAGGGLGLVYAADVVVAADDARLVTAFGQIGLTGDGGGTWHLPRRIGPARAAWAYLSGEPIDAQQALEWGLVTEVVPTAELQERAQAVAARLAAGPTRAYAGMRQLLRESWDRSLPDLLHAEIAALATSARTDDARNAIAAFLAKKTPTYEGA